MIFVFLSESSPFSSVFSSTSVRQLLLVCRFLPTQWDCGFIRIWVGTAQAIHQPAKSGHTHTHTLLPLLLFFHHLCPKMDSSFSVSFFPTKAEPHGPPTSKPAPSVLLLSTSTQLCRVYFFCSHTIFGIYSAQLEYLLCKKAGSSEIQQGDKLEEMRLLFL